MRRVAAGFVGVAVGILVRTSSHASSLDIKIAPGPTVISAEEKAIQADPGKGIRDGVVLVDEAELTETPGMNTDYTYHFRAKILSNKGRDLANIEMPWNMEESGLYEWWGRTILPDGTVLELSKEDFVQQPILKKGNEEQRVLRGALPGVVPGCVIDYGYDYLGVFEFNNYTLHLNREWPVRDFRFRWKFPQHQTGGYRLKTSPGLDVQVVEDKKSILVTGHNLPPIIEEPYMPPSHELEALVTLYYPYHRSSFWNELGTDMENQVAMLVVPGKATFLKTLETLPFTEGATPQAKLEQVYNWMERTLADTDLLTYEEDHARAAKEADKKTPRLPPGMSAAPTADSILKDKAADGFNLARMYIGFVRGLGGHANLILAADRRDHIWDRELLVRNQFDEFLVAVRGPDDPPAKTVYVDPGSGLSFGEIPWWLTGTAALVVGSGGSLPIVLPPSDPRKNISETHGAIAFTENNAKMTFAWSRSGKGQQGLNERRYIRDLAPAERRKHLDAACGSIETSELKKAEAPGFDALGKGFALECEGSDESGLDNDVGLYALAVRGPWIEDPPELTAATRVHPIIFEFPRVDLCTLEVAPPAGFAVKGAPEPIKIDSKFGRYLLSITVAGNGSYHVERKFALVPIAVPAAEYDELKRFLADVRRADKTRLEFQRGAAKS